MLEPLSSAKHSGSLGWRGRHHLETELGPEPSQTKASFFWLFTNIWGFCFVGAESLLPSRPLSQL